MIENIIYKCNHEDILLDVSLLFDVKERKAHDYLGQFTAWIVLL